MQVKYNLIPKKVEIASYVGCCTKLKKENNISLHYYFYSLTAQVKLDFEFDHSSMRWWVLFHYNDTVKIKKEKRERYFHLRLRNKENIVTTDQSSKRKDKEYRRENIDMHIPFPLKKYETTLDFIINFEKYKKIK